MELCKKCNGLKIEITDIKKKLQSKSEMNSVKDDFLLNKHHSSKVPTTELETLQNIIFAINTISHNNENNNELQKLRKKAKVIVSKLFNNKKFFHLPEKSNDILCENNLLKNPVEKNHCDMHLAEDLKFSKISSAKQKNKCSTLADDDELILKNNELKEQITELSIQLEKVKEEMNDKEKSNRKLWIDKNKMITTLKDKIKGKDIEIENLKKMFNKLDAKINRLSTRLKCEQGTNLDLLNQLKIVNTKTGAEEERNSSRKEMSEKIENLINELNETKEKYDSIKEKFDQSNSESQLLKNELSELMKMVENKNNTINDLQSELKRTEDNLNETSSLFGDLKNKTDLLMKKLDKNEEKLLRKNKIIQKLILKYVNVNKIRNKINSQRSISTTTSTNSLRERSYSKGEFDRNKEKIQTIINKLKDKRSTHTPLEIKQFKKYFENTLDTVNSHNKLQEEMDLMRIKTALGDCQKFTDDISRDLEGSVGTVSTVIGDDIVQVHTSQKFKTDSEKTQDVVEINNVHWAQQILKFKSINM